MKTPESNTRKKAGIRASGTAKPKAIPKTASATGSARVSKKVSVARPSAKTMKKDVASSKTKKAPVTEKPVSAAAKTVKGKIKTIETSPLKGAAKKIRAGATPQKKKEITAPAPKVTKVTRPSGATKSAAAKKPVAVSARKVKTRVKAAETLSSRKPAIKARAVSPIKKKVAAPALKVTKVTRPSGATKSVASRKPASSSADRIRSVEHLPSTKPAADIKVIPASGKVPLPAKHTEVKPQEKGQGLPEEYFENELLVMAVDPHVLYVNWEIRQEEIPEGSASLALRIFNTPLPEDEPVNAVVFAHIAVADRVGAGFFHLNMSGQDATIEIGIVDTEGIFQPVMRSEIVSFPATTIPDDLGIAETLFGPEMPIGYS